MSAANARTVNIGEFRNRASELVRSVEESGQPILISRRGLPVAELRPVRQGSSRPLRGSVKIAPGVDLTEPVVDPEAWEVMK